MSLLINPKKYSWKFSDAQSQEMMKKTISFFETKGLAYVKKDDHERVWYADFVDFVMKERIFAQLMTPQGYGAADCRWDSYRNSAFNEILGFYGLAYWYTWQVSMLGLGPIWLSDNETIKKQTASLLEEGAIFAFGLSEKEHGADIYSSDMRLKSKGDAYVANGRKYYIGNGQKAAITSTFGMNEDSKEYVFFAARSEHPNYNCIQNVVNSQNYVAEFELRDYPVTKDEILSQGTHAWDSALNTINFCKYNLGWASIGICTHSFYEAINHASKRVLFGKKVTEFPQVKQLFVDAYARLVAMKAFSLRASDYMRAASEHDRRYLLYNPMVKMKVTTQGEEVMNLLWDVIAAKGFEKNMFFEMAARDIRALPKLEGTVHVNMALIIKFMKNYFFNPGKFASIPKMDQATNDDFLFRQGPTKGLGKIQFHDYKPVYANWDLPNIKIFKQQITVLKSMLVASPPSKQQTEDLDFLLILGELFTLVVYGQLILENAKECELSDDLVDQIFDFMVRDFSKFALQLSSKPSSTVAQRALCMAMMRKPSFDEKRFTKIYEEVLAHCDAYEMNP